MGISVLGMMADKIFEEILQFRVVGALADSPCFACMYRYGYRISRIIGRIRNLEISDFSVGVCVFHAVGHIVKSCIHDCRLFACKCVHTVCKC